MKVNIIYRQLSEIVYDTNKKALCGRGAQQVYTGRREDGDFLLRAKSRLITQNSVFNGCITGWLQLAFLA